MRGNTWLRAVLTMSAVMALAACSGGGTADEARDENTTTSTRATTTTSTTTTTAVPLPPTEAPAEVPTAPSRSPEPAPEPEPEPAPTGPPGYMVKAPVPNAQVDYCTRQVERRYEELVAHIQQSGLPPDELAAAMADAAAARASAIASCEAGSVWHGP